jgi:hypothetical protein
MSTLTYLPPKKASYLPGKSALQGKKRPFARIFVSEGE